LSLDTTTRRIYCPFARLFFGFSVSVPQNAMTAISVEGPRPEVAAALRPALPGLADEVISAVRRSVPAYADPLKGSYGANIRLGVEQALDGFVAMLGSGQRGRLPGREVYLRLGGGELREGRSLEALLAAYRAGARVAWRGMAAAGEAAGLPAPIMYQVAEAVFAFIDELSAASAEGFAREQSARAGEQQARRRQLLDLLVSAPAVSESIVQAAAAGVGWPLPGRLAAVAFRCAEPQRVVHRLPLDALVGARGDHHLALVPDPDAPGRRQALQRALGAVPAALGPAGSPAEAAWSAQCAREALDLSPIDRGRDDPGAEPLILAEERMVDLMLHRDRRLAAALVRRRLAPLDALSPGARVRLRETLDVWLDHQGDTRATAEALHVHVQTVRYRVGQLRDRLGDGLDDPTGRLELALALRVGAGIDATERP